VFTYAIELTYTDDTMASELAPVNGNGTFANPHVGPPSTSPAPSAPSSEPSKHEVAWYFVERYYNHLSRKPEHLFLFFGKRSQYVVGVEEEKVQVCIGQNVSEMPMCSRKLSC
jgi:hypothetical protein